MELQTDIGLCCLYIPNDTFSHSDSNISYYSQIIGMNTPSETVFRVDPFPKRGKKKVHLFPVTLCMLGKNFSRRHFEIFSYCFPRKQDLTLKQIFSLGDSLYEVSDPVFWEK